MMLYKMFEINLEPMLRACICPKLVHTSRQLFLKYRCMGKWVSQVLHKYAILLNIQQVVDKSFTGGYAVYSN